MTMRKIKFMFWEKKNQPIKKKKSKKWMTDEVLLNIYTVIVYYAIISAVNL